MTANKPGLLMVWTDIPEALECDFNEWYNREHYHSSLGLLTPWSVHTGEFEHVLQKRQEVLDRTYAAHPERFVRGRPAVQRPPARVWINEPQAVEIST